VRVDAYGPDQYKRMLGVIWDEQVNVNLLMMAVGYPEVESSWRRRSQQGKPRA
jgi:hypothetical protein